MLTLSVLPMLSPVYTSCLLLNANYSGASSLHYYKFKVLINNILRDSFDYFANPLTKDATISLSTVLSTYFETTVFTPTGNTTIEAIPNSIIPYEVQVYVYDSGNTFVESGTTLTKYMFNGCFNFDEGQDVKDYMHLDSNAKFLTNWQGTHEITMNDYAYLQTLNGSYGSGYTSDFQGITITRYQIDGSSSGETIANIDAASKTIFNIDVSPSSLNVFYPGFIDDNTSYYTVESLYRPANLITININRENKLTKFYNFIYTNRLGGTDFVTFVKTSDNNYKVGKQTLEQFVPKKTYYTTVEQITTVQSQFFTAEMADGVKELFYSPAVKLWFNNRLSDIRIVNANVLVLDRYPKDKFIQFEIQFSYNNKFYVQQF